VSIESLSIAMNHSRATGTARLVLLGIANHDGDGGSWPSVARLQRYAGGADRRTVQRAIDRLEALGEVRRIIQQGGDHNTADDRRPNLYRVLLQCPHDCDRTANHNTSRTVQTMLPEQLSTGAASAPPRGADAARGGGADAAQTIQETINTQVLKVTPDTRAKAEVSTGGICVAGHPLAPGTDMCLYACMASFHAAEAVHA